MDKNPFLERLRDTKLSRKVSPQRAKSLADQRIEEGIEQGAFEQLDGEGKPIDGSDKKGLPLTAARVGTIAEQRIQAAMEDGMFDNLEGAGKPLDLFDDAYVPADMRMAFRMMKGQQAGAPWVGVMRDYEQELKRYYTWRNNNRAAWPRLSPYEQQLARAELPKRIKEVNDLAHQMNSLVPVARLRVGLLTYVRELPELEGNE